MGRVVQMYSRDRRKRSLMPSFIVCAAMLSPFVSLHALATHSQKAKAATQSTNAADDPSFDLNALFQLVDKNDPEATWFLAEICRDESLMPKAPKSLKDAAIFYRHAAQAGLAKAQYDLGFALYWGRGVPKDYREATVWFRKAAAQEEYADSALVGIAQQTLGAMYADGLGVTQDYIESARWYNKAAERGNVRAQVALAEMYGAGRGVVQDFVHAHMWLNIAAASASPPDEQLRRARDVLAGEMTPEQVAEAQRRASAWMAEHPMPSSSEYRERVTKADDPSLPKLQKLWNAVSASTHLILSRQSGGDVSKTDPKK